MIHENIQIDAGLEVVHDEGGLRYVIEGVRMSAEGYETTNTLGGRVVLYTQLEDGSYPSGTGWVRSEGDFRKNFSLVED